MNSMKPANSFAASASLKLRKRVEQIFFFHTLLNFMSFSSYLVFSTQEWVNGEAFGLI